MKIIKKIRTIKMCLNCGNKETYEVLGRVFWKCKGEDRKIKYPTKIPSWCPLEDYEKTTIYDEMAEVAAREYYDGL